LLIYLPHMDSEPDLSARITEIEPYQVGSIPYGDTDIPRYRVKVQFSVDRYKGPRRAEIVVSLSYIDLTFPDICRNRFEAAHQEFDVYFDKPQLNMVADFDIYNLSRALYEGETHLSTLEAKIYSVDKHEELRRIG